jgi:hypothetical protein
MSIKNLIIKLLVISPFAFLGSVSAQTAAPELNPNNLSFQSGGVGGRFTVNYQNIQLVKTFVSKNPVFNIQGKVLNNKVVDAFGFHVLNSPDFILAGKYNDPLAEKCVAMAQEFSTLQHLSANAIFSINFEPLSYYFRPFDAQPNAIVYRIDGCHIKQKL